jgi:hypothetical protein
VCALFNHRGIGTNASFLKSCCREFYPTFKHFPVTDSFSIQPISPIGASRLYTQPIAASLPSRPHYWFLQLSQYSQTKLQPNYFILKESNQYTVITINVPVVFMARYIMILRGATSLRGALEGVGSENLDFFGPRSCHLGPKKSRFSGPTPSNAPSNDVAPSKSLCTAP